MTTLTQPLLDVLRWPQRLTVSTWADEHRVLVQPSAEPGPWRTARVPYMREIMDAATVPHVRQVTLCKSTQVGGTEALLNVLAFAIAEDPGPILWVTPRREDADGFGESRILPMIRACPTLERQLAGERWDAKRRRIRFRRCSLHLRSARVPSELASLPCRWLFGDEAGKWVDWSDREAAPWELALERTRTYWNHKAFLCSTPTVAGNVILREFEAGDRRRYHVPCPHCGRFQVLRWPQVKWPADVRDERTMLQRREAWYECEHCQQRIADAHKPDMLARGAWVPEGAAFDVVDGRLRLLVPDTAPHRSYHLWAGYSPWLCWWEMAAKFLRSKDDPSQLQNFANSWLAEPFEDRVVDVRDKTVQACIDANRKMGDVPAEAQVLLASVDVQEHYLVWCIAGFGVDEESWIIAAGRAATFDELAIVLRQSWGDRQLPVRLCVIDSRHRRAEVLDFTRAHQPLVRMIAGVERSEDMVVPFGSIKVDRHPRTGAPLPSSLVITTVAVELFKDLVAMRMERAATEPEQRAGRIHLPNNLPPEFVRQMSAEHKVRERSGSRMRTRWVLKPGHQRNELWDLVVYVAAAARMAGLDRRLRSDAQAPPAARPRPRPAGRESGGPFSAIGR